MTYRAAPVALVAVLAVALALPAAATSYVMVSDQHLVQTSAAAVEARVLSVDSAPSGAMPFTDYLIEVDRLLSGEIPGRNLIVRIPGGERPDGVGLKLFGLPEFAQGQRVLLFLNPRQDGTYGVSDLLLGAFREVVQGGRAVLVRDHLSAAQELAMPGEPVGSRDGFSRPRAAEAFARWVEATGRGDEARADYFLEPDAATGSASSVTGRYVLFTDLEDHIPLRWFVFDSGGHVDWEMQGGGQPGYTSSQTASAFKTAMNAWNNESTTTVDYRYLGAGAPTTGFTNGPDTHNSLIFANADGNITSGDFTCNAGGGGTLAIGGPWYVGPMKDPRGISFHRITEAEIITNKGIQCFMTALSNPQRGLEQLFAHELGHTLGLGHSCEDQEGCPAKQLDALMYAFFHEDGRGAVLTVDDRNGLRQLYPGNQAPANPPAAPSGLAPVAISTHEVVLGWNDNSGDETGFVLQGRESGGVFADLQSLPADSVEATVSGLDDDTSYDFRVRAFNGAGSSAYSSTLSLQTLLDVPDAPSDLVATAVGPSSVALSWEDRSDNETGWVAEARSPQSGQWDEVAIGEVAAPANAPPGSTTVATLVSGLDAEVPVAFRIRARNAAGDSQPSNTSAATPEAASSGGCDDSGDAICLLGDRFQVSVQWHREDNGNSGTGKGEVFPSSDRSGTFWFFNPQNIELIVKVLDGSGNNGYYWTFYGALSNVEYWITVVDTTTSDSRTYYNPPGNECGQFDTTSLPGDAIPFSGAVAAAPAAATPVTAANEAATCVPDDTTLCLLDGRFKVEVDWANQRNPGATGVGHSADGPEAGEKTGYFWFFNPANIELVVKVLDSTSGPGSNGYFWFFYGALSDVEYHVTVTDTTSGVSRTYDNAAYGKCGNFDTRAFTPDGQIPTL